MWRDSGQPMVFTLTEAKHLDDAGKTILVAKIQGLGGRLEDSDNWSATVTHVLVCSPRSVEVPRTHKVMCSLASGRLLLRLKYVYRSFEARRWLNPEDPQYLVLPKFCLHSREQWRARRRGPFSEMRAAFISTLQARRDAYWDILEAGGATVVKAENFSELLERRLRGDQLTHVFFDPVSFFPDKPEHRSMKPFKMFAGYAEKELPHVVYLSYKYLTDCLFSDQPVNPLNYDHTKIKPRTQAQASSEPMETTAVCDTGQNGAGTSTNCGVLAPKDAGDPNGHCSTSSVPSRSVCLGDSGAASGTAPRQAATGQTTEKQPSEGTTPCGSTESGKGDNEWLGKRRPAFSSASSKRQKTTERGGPVEVLTIDDDSDEEEEDIQLLYEMLAKRQQAPRRYIQTGSSGIDYRQMCAEQKRELLKSLAPAPDPDIEVIWTKETINLDSSSSHSSDSEPEIVSDGESGPCGSMDVKRSPPSQGLRRPGVASRPPPLLRLSSSEEEEEEEEDSEVSHISRRKPDEVEMVSAEDTSSRKAQSVLIKVEKESMVEPPLTSILSLQPPTRLPPDRLTPSDAVSTSSQSPASATIPTLAAPSLVSTTETIGLEESSLPLSSIGTSSGGPAVLSKLPSMSSTEPNFPSSSAPSEPPRTVPLPLSSNVLSPLSRAEPAAPSRTVPTALSSTVPVSLSSAVPSTPSSTCTVSSARLSSEHLPLSKLVPPPPSFSPSISQSAVASELPRADTAPSASSEHLLGSSYQTLPLNLPEQAVTPAAPVAKSVISHPVLSELSSPKVKFEKFVSPLISAVPSSRVPISVLSTTGTDQPLAAPVPVAPPVVAAPALAPTSPVPVPPVMPRFKSEPVLPDVVPRNTDDKTALTSAVKSSLATFTIVPEVGADSTAVMRDAKPLDDSLLAKTAVGESQQQEDKDLFKKLLMALHDRLRRSNETLTVGRVFAVPPQYDRDLVRDSELKIKVRERVYSGAVALFPKSTQLGNRPPLLKNRGDKENLEDLQIEHVNTQDIVIFLSKLEANSQHDVASAAVLNFLFQQCLLNVHTPIVLHCCLYLNRDCLLHLSKKTRREYATRLLAAMTTNAIINKDFQIDNPHDLGEANCFWNRLLTQLADASAVVQPEGSGAYHLFTILVGIFQKDLEIWWCHQRNKHPEAILPVFHYVLGGSKDPARILSALEPLLCLYVKYLKSDRCTEVVRRCLGLAGLWLSYIDAQDDHSEIAEGSTDQLATGVSALLTSAQLSPHQIYMELAIIQPNWLSALISYKLRYPELVGRRVKSLSVTLAGLSISGRQEEERKEEEEGEKKIERLLLTESFAHKFIAYSQAHALFRAGWQQQEEGKLTPTFKYMEGNIADLPPYKSARTRGNRKMFKVGETLISLDSLRCVVNCLRSASSAESADPAKEDTPLRALMFKMHGPDDF